MDLSDLRQAAIHMLERSSSDANPLQQQPPEELLQELRVQQIELEMQNDELRRAQLELEESRDRFANLFDFAPVGYVTVDTTSRIVEANLTIAKLLGVDRRTLVGQSLSRYVAPEEMLRLSSHLRDANASDRKTRCELTLRRADGSQLLARLDSRPLADVHGGHRCSIAITDISDLAELAHAKRESDERLQIICHALPIPIAYIDCACKYQFNNAAHEQWFKMSREAIVGRHVRELLGDDIYHVAAPHIDRALAGRASSCRLELPDGETAPRLVEVHYAPHLHAERGVLGIYELMIDIRADRHVEELEARRAELETQLLVLSRRQRAVFDLLLAGKSNKTIAYELERSMRTVERERHNIIELLGVDSIAQLLVKFAGLAASANATETPHL